MDIRTKLALALVSVSLLSMALLGTFAYYTSARLLQEISVRQLDALAESKKRDLEKVQEGWKDQLRLIRMRTDLRMDLSRIIHNEDEETRAAVRQVIEDAVTATDNLDRLTIYDLNQNEVVGFGRAVVPGKPVFPAQGPSVVYGGTYLTEDGNLRVVFTSTLELAGSVIGYAEGVFDATDLYTVTGNFTGLGETGEALVVMSEGEDQILVLNPVRHLMEDGLRRVRLEDAPEPMRQVLAGNEVVISDGVRDYRGERVLAATRFVDGLSWGLIVKIDQAEEAGRALELRESMIDIGLALSAFAIIGGTLLGLYLARPIHQLAELVRRIRHGETALRADAEGDDEIAYLSESLNELLDHLDLEGRDNTQKNAHENG
ncbi:MAG: HAMP domain-containing protein [Pseudomonadales bacterium]|nr:HAMP domain-containing protein [Pseudomonadales bacterium]